MPEYPEVHALSNHITKSCKGKTLQSIHILKGRYQKHGPPNQFKEFTHQLPLTLTHVIQKGKVMALCFENDWYMISRLGLTGWWYINDDKPSWINTQPNVTFQFKGLALNYVDQLSYGTLSFLHKEAFEKEFNKLAPDYASITFKELQERLQKKPSFLNKPIEEVLVDQHGLMSGIGNYLKAEVLYDAKISPLRKVKDVTEKEWKHILTSSKKITQQIEKHLGDETKYINTMKIYMKEQDPLGNKIITHKTKTGRTTHWVKEIQH